MTTLTWKPKKKKRLRKHGYLQVSSTKAGQKRLKNRRRQGRHRLAVSGHSK